MTDTTHTLTKSAHGRAFRAPTRFGSAPTALGPGFGGAFAPETLMENLIELESCWLDAREDPAFRAEFDGLLRDFAGRATPLTHAERLSRETGADVWLKREDLLHTGAHKLNNTLGQCLLARRMGKRHVIAETGAGQHGVASATTAARLGLGCTVYMGARDVERQRTNVERMRILGAEVVPVTAGDATLRSAVDEALRAWVRSPAESHYLLGSALGPHPFPSIVADFQSVIGREARAQFLERNGCLPDVAVACVGGGSNAIGLFRGFQGDDVELVGVEAGGAGIASGRHAARFADGRPGVLHGASTFVLQSAAGQVRETFSISAGLDYAAVGPEHAALAAAGRARYSSASDEEAVAAFLTLARLEGIVPALESSHALAWVLRERASLSGRRVLVNVSGRGDKDLAVVAAHVGGAR